MAVPKLKYFIQCDEVRNDGGKFSAIGLFENIFSFLFPASHKRFFLLLGFTGTEGEHKLEIIVAAPDGQQIGTISGELQLKSAEHVGNVVFEFSNLPLPMEGRYTLTLFLDGDFCAEHFFTARPPFPRRQRSPEEIAELLARPETIQTANADVKCDKCGAVYRYQHHLNPAGMPDPGFIKLPPGEFFLCGRCGHKVPLTQVRQNLENIVGLDRRWLEQMGGFQQATAQRPQGSPEQINDNGSVPPAGHGQESNGA